MKFSARRSSSSRWKRRIASISLSRMTPYPARSRAFTPRCSQPGLGAYDGATTPMTSPLTSAGGLRSGGSAEVGSSGLIEQGREQHDPAGPTNVVGRESGSGRGRCGGVAAPPPPPHPPTPPPPHPPSPPTPPPLP